MFFALLAILIGLLILVWSADRFVDGAASFARYLGMKPLLIGIVIVGFGTSAPEMIVSALSSLNGNPGIALGNAYGSNITNIALILGLTALIKPLLINADVMKKELPILALVTLLSAYLIHDYQISSTDAAILLICFALYMCWTIWQAAKQKQQTDNEDMPEILPIKSALLWLAIGLILLMASSQLLVWGAVKIASYLGVSDLVIGLTIVAVGTSLPELASSIAAARKNEVDLAVGNIIGSNLFNSLAVVGIAGIISPIQAGSEIFTRDMTVMTILTFSLFIFGISLRGKEGKINRIEGGMLFTSYAVYTLVLIQSAVNM